MTHKTPKSLTDLRYQDNVTYIPVDVAPETTASRWFSDIFDSAEEPFCRKLFTEDSKNVYECYVDSGSVDYLYIVQG